MDTLGEIKGMSMHFHPDCIKKMFDLIPKEGV